MDWNEIESRQNPAVKFAASLTEKKARDREGVFIAEGTTLFFDLCAQKVFPEKVYLSRDAIGLRQKIEKCLDNAGTEAYLLSPAAFEKVTTEKGSEGLVALFSKKALAASFPPIKPRRLVALENLQDPGNVGTILRSAASFGFDAVLLTGCADPFGTKAVRASMGAIARIPLLFFSDCEDMMDQLDAWGVHTVAACLSSDAVSIRKASLTEPVCVLIGNEGNGLSPTVVLRAKEKSIIPIRNMESLNAAAAATIFLWEIAERNGNE